MLHQGGPKHWGNVKLRNFIIRFQGWRISGHDITSEQEVGQECQSGRLRSRRWGMSWQAGQKASGWWTWVEQIKTKQKRHMKHIFKKSMRKFVQNRSSGWEQTTTKVGETQRNNTRSWPWPTHHGWVELQMTGKWKKKKNYINFWIS